ncbi:hypothetical protein JCM8547_003797 [Rhodosporidiobolus lusitaniae]
MPPTALSALSKLLSDLEKECKGNKALQKTAKELGELIKVDKDDERSLHAHAARLNELSSRSSPLQILLTSQPRLSLLVLSKLVTKLTSGISGVFKARTSRNELVKGEKKRLEAWEAVLDGLSRVLAVFLDEREEATTDQEKESFGEALLTPLAGIVKLDPGARRLRPALLRRLFNIFEHSTARHTANKTRVSTLSCVGPALLASILSFATDYKLTSQALELAFRLGEHIEKEVKDARGKWVAHVWPEGEYGKKGTGEVSRLVAKLTLKSYVKDSPAILDFLSVRSLSKFQLFPCVRLSFASSTFSHSNASPAFVETGSFDGEVALNGTTFSASVGVPGEEEENEEEETLEATFEFAWDGVEKIVLSEGKEGKDKNTFIASFWLSSPPSLDSDVLSPPEKGKPSIAEVELKEEDRARFIKTLQSREVPLPGVSSSASTKPAPPVSTTSRSNPDSIVNRAGVTSAPPSKRMAEKAVSTATTTAAATKKPAPPPPNKLKKRVLAHNEDEDESLQPAKKRSTRSSAPPVERAKKKVLVPPTPTPRPSSSLSGATAEEEGEEGEEGGGLSEFSQTLANLPREKTREVVERLVGRLQSEREEEDEMKAGEGMGEEGEGGYGGGVEGGGEGMELDHPPHPELRLHVSANAFSSRPAVNAPSLIFAYPSKPPRHPHPPLTTDPHSPSALPVAVETDESFKKKGGKGKPPAHVSFTSSALLHGHPSSAPSPTSPHASEAEAQLALALDALSSVVLSAFSLRSASSREYLTGAQAGFVRGLRGCVGGFGEESSTILAHLLLTTPCSPPFPLLPAGATTRANNPNEKTARLMKECRAVEKKSREAVQGVLKQVKGGGGKGVRVKK